VCAVKVVAIALGESPRIEVEAALKPDFASADVTWLERGEFRRRPVRTLMSMARRRFDAAVLVAPDLSQPRLRLTSLVLALPRADQRWRLDLRGGREAWNLWPHLGRHALAISRHLLACGLALLLAEPVLRAIDALIEPRMLRATATQRLLYLRTQLWLGLEGGGSVAHSAGVIGGLERSGVDVRVVSSDRLRGVSAPTIVITPELWFDGGLRELEDLAYNIVFLAGALRSALRTRPQVIYQRHTAFNVVGAVLSRLLRVPLVLEFNSSELWKGRYWGGLRCTRAAALVERINMRAADRVIVVSRVLQADLIDAGVPANKIVVNPNAVDPERFTPIMSGSQLRRKLGWSSTIVVGFSGTFGAWHGIATLAQALSLVLRARPQVRWLLMGDGPLRPLVDAAVEREKIAEFVHQAGMVPHAEMPACLSACDVLVSPHGRQADSGEFFGSPTKLFEYMAVGRPIVASAVGQIAEVLRDRESALLVPPDDPELLSQAIVRLVDDACLRVWLARAAREAAEQRHTWRQNAARVLKCVEAG
jgi:glycosyltransferase involved in cell wall biosynthesis